MTEYRENLTNVTEHLNTIQHESFDAFNKILDSQPPEVTAVKVCDTDAEMPENWQSQNYVEIGIIQSKPMVAAAPHLKDDEQTISQLSPTIYPLQNIDAENTANNYFSMHHSQPIHPPPPTNSTHIQSSAYFESSSFPTKDCQISSNEVQSGGATLIKEPEISHNVLECSNEPINKPMQQLGKCVDEIVACKSNKCDSIINVQLEETTSVEACASITSNSTDSLEDATKENIFNVLNPMDQVDQNKDTETTKEVVNDTLVSIGVSENIACHDEPLTPEKMPTTDGEELPTPSIEQSNLPEPQDPDITDAECNSSNAEEDSSHSQNEQSEEEQELSEPDNCNLVHPVSLTLSHAALLANPEVGPSVGTKDIASDEQHSTEEEDEEQNLSAVDDGNSDEDHTRTSNISEDEYNSADEPQQQVIKPRKKRRRIVNDDDESADEEIDRNCLLRDSSPMSFTATESIHANPSVEDEEIMAAEQELENLVKNERPGPKSKKASTHMIKELQARALLRSAIVIPAAVDIKKRKNRILDSDEEADKSDLNVDDIGLPDSPADDIDVKVPLPLLISENEPDPPKTILLDRVTKIVPIEDIVGKQFTEQIPIQHFPSNMDRHDDSSLDLHDEIVSRSFVDEHSTEQNVYHVIKLEKDEDNKQQLQKHLQMYSVNNTVGHMTTNPSGSYKQRSNGSKTGSSYANNKNRYDSKQ